MKRVLFTVVALVLLAVGCAPRPAMRSEYTDLPQLEDGWSRIHVTAGKMSFARLWSTGQVGPFFINDQQVGSTAKDEHFIVDLLPGTYEVHCTTQEPQKKLHMEKREITFRAGEKRYFACDMATTAGGNFGLIGALASKYTARIYLDERPFDNPNSKLVSYKKLQ